MTTPKDRAELVEFRAKALNTALIFSDGSWEDLNPGRQSQLRLQALESLKAEEAAGLAVVPVEPTDASIANGVVFLIDANLDGPDGVGHSDVQGCFAAMLAASPYRSKP